MLPQWGKFLFMLRSRKNLTLNANWYAFSSLKGKLCDWPHLPLKFGHQEAQRPYFWLNNGSYVSPNILHIFVLLSSLLPLSLILDLSLMFSVVWILFLNLYLFLYCVFALHSGANLGRMRFAVCYTDSAWSWSITGRQAWCLPCGNVLLPSR